MGLESVNMESDNEFKLYEVSPVDCLVEFGEYTCIVDVKIENKEESLDCTFALLFGG